MIKRFLANTPGVELVWLCDGVDTGEGSAFVSGLAAIEERKGMTVISGGLPTPRALAAAENTAGALTVKVLRPQATGDDVGLVRALDLKGSFAGRCELLLCRQPA